VRIAEDYRYGYFSIAFNGILIALEPINLGLAIIGVIVGLFVGAMPGLGSVNGVAILLPFTFVIQGVHRWCNLANDFPSLNLLWGNVWRSDIIYHAWHSGGVNCGCDNL
jgi:hypothetical protein